MTFDTQHARLHRSLACAAALALAASAAAADDAAAPADDAQKAWSVTVGGGALHQFTTDLDRAGDVSVERGYGVVAAGMGLSPALSLGLRVAWEGAWYDIDPSSVLALGSGSRPWRSIQGVQLGASATWSLSESWSIMGGAFGGAAGESDADAGDAMTFGGHLAVAWRASDRLTLGGGVLASSQIEDDVLVVPLLLVDWRITDSLRLTNVAGPEAYPTGAGLELVCDALDGWEFGIGGRWESRRFRLDDVGPAPEGVGEDSGLGLWLRAGARPVRGLRLDLLVGMMVGEELSLDDRNGNALASDDLDPSPFAALFLGYRF